MHKTLCCNRIGILARLRLGGLDRFGKSMPFGPAVLLTRWSYLGKVFRRLLASLIECQNALLAENDVRAPFLLNLDGWTHLQCAHCKARLEMQPPRSFLLGPLMAPLLVLARQGRVFEVIAFGSAFVTIFLVLFESFRPKLRLRKRPLAKAVVQLKIDGPPN